MKTIAKVLMAVLIFASCETEQVNETLGSQSIKLKARKKMDICHYSADSDSWIIINLNENAWPDHKAHGDVRLDDQDGDGYVPSNNCGFEGENGMGDCDDNNVDINPGAEEIFGNDIDDDCNPGTPDSQLDVLRIIHEVNGGKPDAWDDNIIANDEDLNNWEGVGINRDGTIRELDLRLSELTTLPPEIGRLTDLKTLDLSFNQFTVLPIEIGLLTNLMALNLSYNQFTFLPTEIGYLTDLISLSISSNQLSILPPEIGQLENLFYFYLSNNHLIELPTEIGLLSNLQDLYLDVNQLGTLPSEIGQLASLLTLDISGNPVVVIPKEICALTPGTTLLKDPEDVCETP